MGYPVDADEVRAYGDVLKQCYEITDAELASMLERLPPNANVVLVSDHGMHVDIETKDDPDSITSGHHQTGPSGLFGAFGPAFAHTGSLFSESDPRGRIGEVRCIAPLALHQLGLPVPEDWPVAQLGNPLEQLLEPGWFAEHPGRLRTSPDEQWRELWPRSLPIAPLKDLNQGFEDMMDSLGYMRGRKLPSEED